MCNLKDYFSNDILDQEWLKDSPMFYQRLESHNIQTDCARQLWDEEQQRQWEQGMDWRYLYMRSGRPHCNDLALNAEALLGSCKIHLNDCFSRSFNNCDLVENNTASVYYCAKCRGVIHQNGESLVYCPRCSRQERPQRRGYQ